MIKKKSTFYDISSSISRLSKATKEIDSLNKELEKTSDAQEKEMINSQIARLQDSLKKVNDVLKKDLSILSLVAPVKREKIKQPMFKPIKSIEKKAAEISAMKKSSVKKDVEDIEEFEEETIKRIKELSEKEGKKKKVEKKRVQASNYVRTSNQFFSSWSDKILRKGLLKNLKRDLVKANMYFITKSYVSVILFTTFLSFIASFFIFGFFLFFNFGVMYPFITFANQSVIERAMNTFWIILVIPLITFFVVYFYPKLEKKSIETKISQELPFATIHMASISESMIEPTNIFKIMITTKDYPTLQKEFIKLINKVNVLGKDLVTALRDSAFNSPSRKLAELYDGLATTITSGGDLSEFFEKRAQTLLFEYRLEKEKKTRSAETFMDIYISVVIAAPMILMLLLIMMRVSGLGISLSTGMISLVMVAGVSFVNIVFLTFLQMRSQT